MDFLKIPARTWVLALAALAFLPGCGPSFRIPADHMDDVAADEVAVVGRVYLNPPLGKGEQNVQWGIGMDWFRYAYLVLAPGPLGDKELPSSGTDLSPLEGAVQASWNQWFFVRMPRKDFYVQMLAYFTDVTSRLDCASCHTATSNWNRAYLPLDEVVRVRPDDRVLFIGSLVFYRDEFNRPRGVRAVNDVAKAGPYIRARFGSAPLRVALPEKP